jgi:DNA sulfur modification protein DndB
LAKHVKIIGVDVRCWVPEPASFGDDLGKVRRQLRTTDPEVVTITTLRGACVTLAKGINGVQFGARPVPLDATLAKQVETAAVEWFTELTEVFGSAFENREHSLASSPTAMAALGAIGNPLIHISNPQDRLTKARDIIKTLSNVDWSRGQTWEGIAGKFTPKGAFSLGGSKETAYAVFAALSDPTSAGYARVRNAPTSKVA